MSLILRAIGQAMLILMLAGVWALVAFAVTNSWAVGNAAFWVTAVLSLLAWMIDELVGPKRRKKGV